MFVNNYLITNHELTDTCGARTGCLSLIFVKQKGEK